MSDIFLHVGSALDRDGEVPESAHFDLLKCPVCFAVVFRDDCLNHERWHRRLGHVIRPAETAQDAARARHPSGKGMAPERGGSREDGAILSAPDPALTEQDTCDHDWPPDLSSEVVCLNCGMPYDQWSWR